MEREKVLTPLALVSPTFKDKKSHSPMLRRITKESHPSELFVLVWCYLFSYFRLIDFLHLEFGKLPFLVKGLLRVTKKRKKPKSSIKEGGGRERRERSSACLLLLCRGKYKDSRGRPPISSNSTKFTASSRKKRNPQSERSFFQQRVGISKFGFRNRTFIRLKIKNEKFESHDFRKFGKFCWLGITIKIFPYPVPIPPSPQK
jgi:hypothetical protein